MLHAYHKCCTKGQQCISVVEFQKTPNYMIKEGATCFIKKNSTIKYET